MRRPPPTTPDALQAELRDVMDGVQALGRQTERFAADVRATSLSITLEAVKSGVPPGKLRDLAVDLREAASARLNDVVTARARIHHDLGQAMAQVTRLRREIDVVGPARHRAGLLALFLTERVEALRLLAHLDGEAEGRILAGGPAFEAISPENGPCATPRLEVREGRPTLRVPAATGSLVGHLAWSRVAPALLDAAPEGLARALQGGAVRPVQGRSDAPRIWILAEGTVVAGTHAEAPHPLPLGPDQPERLLNAERRKVARVRVPEVVPGLGRWAVQVAAPPAVRPVVRPAGDETAEIIPFPGLGS